MENTDKIKVIKKAVTASQAKSIWKQLGIKKDNISDKQFKMWMNVEREHGSLLSPETDETKDDAIKTGKIAWAHLKEMSDYYTRLSKMEKEWEKKSEAKWDKDDDEQKYK